MYEWKIYGDTWLNLSKDGLAHWVRVSSIQQVIEMASFDKKEGGSKLILNGGAFIETKTTVKAIMKTITNPDKEKGEASHE